MKKLFLSSLAVLVSATAASAADIKPYVGANFGYEHAAYNDMVLKESGIYFNENTEEFEARSGKSHLGNIMGGGMTMGLTGGAEYRVSKWFGLRGEIEYMYSRQNNAHFKFSTEEDFNEEELIAFDEAFDEAYDFGEDFDPQNFDWTEYDAAYDVALSQAQTQKHKMAVDINTHALLLNVYADFHNCSAFTPYLTAGLGYAWTDVKEDSNDSDKMHIKDNGLAWQVGAGVSYSATKALNLDLGYRFVKLADIKDKDSGFEEDGSTWSQKLSITPMMHQVRLGARYAF